MARKGKKRNGRKFSLPISVVAGVVPGLSRNWFYFRNPAGHGTTSGLEAASIESSRIYLGYDPRTGQFNPGWMAFGLGPLLVGFIVHWLVGSKLGVNRALGRAGIPVFRV